MEPIFSKKIFQKDFIFYEDSLKIINKNGSTMEIQNTSITNITYHLKFKMRDFFKLFFLFGSDKMLAMPKLLIIYFNEKPNFVSLRLNKKEYEVLIARFKKPINLI